MSEPQEKPELDDAFYEEEYERQLILKRQHEYEKRALGKKDFYARARMNEEKLKVLQEALLRSAVVDKQGNVLAKWTPDLIESLFDEIQDPGPKNKKRDSDINSNN